MSVDMLMVPPFGMASAALETRFITVLERCTGAPRTLSRSGSSLVSTLTLGWYRFSFWCSGLFRCSEMILLRFTTSLVETPLLERVRRS